MLATGLLMDIIRVPVKPHERELVETLQAATGVRSMAEVYRAAVREYERVLIASGVYRPVERAV